MSEEKKTFDMFGFSDKIRKVISDVGYENPTPIQAQAIPKILMGQDVIGLAQTGTGKTASFTLPMIEILHTGRAKRRMPRSLILTPTRELAAQVSENFDTYGKYTALTKALLTGGSSMNIQQKNIENGADVLIATPGRFIDLVDRGVILLNDIKILVIDEADRMLDMGFIPDIEKIISLLPQNRQTLLFSATMPDEIKRLADKFLMNAKTISVARTSATTDNVSQKLLWVPGNKKQNTLLRLLETEAVSNAFVFCNRKRDVDSLTRSLKSKGYKAEAMHGDMPQKHRTETLAAFKEGKITLLICSDVAARGLDVDQVSHVFNYDIPMNAEDYVHRIGRTGRAGHKGKAFSIAAKDKDDKFVASIENLIKKTIQTMSVSGGKLAPKREKSSYDDKPRPEKNKNKGNKHSHKSRNNSKDSEVADTEGFGDHVPDFMKESA